MRVLLTLALGLAGALGTGISGADLRPPAAPAASSSCSADRLAIARRVYAQAQTGRVVTGAAAAVERSAPLAAAVERDDVPAIRAALRPLVQIRRITITRGGHRVAALGRGAALAPVSGVVGDARFTLSTTSAHGFAELIRELTGAGVRTGGALSVTAFPAGAESLRLTGACRSPHPVLTAAQRLLAAERDSPQTRHVLRTVARDPAFIHAVETDDAAGVRAQIVRFFQDPSLHVVRIRAVDAGGQLVNDVGGPYVLAPASMPVTDGGARVGTVTLSIQDDTGYIKLLHRFTGASVQLQTPAGIVPGSEPVAGPAYSFKAQAFPSGPLQVTLGSGAT